MIRRFFLAVPWRWLIVVAIAMGCIEAVTEADRWQRRRELPVPRIVAVEPVFVAPLAEKYRLKIIQDDPRFPVKIYHGVIDGTAASQEILAHYAPILESEFSRYPTEFVRRTGLQRIVVCRDLTFNGSPRTAIPDFENDTLYLDAFRGANYEQYQRLVIHHEFFHIVDYRDDGELYSDNAWAALNSKTFHYGRSGVSMQDDPQSSLLREIAGFLTTYATSGVEEDKAEMFAHMMTHQDAVEKRAETDDVIRKKQLRMRALLEQFCPEVDANFWAAVPRGS